MTHATMTSTLATFPRQQSAAIVPKKWVQFNLVHQLTSSDDVRSRRVHRVNEFLRSSSSGIPNGWIPHTRWIPHTCVINPPHTHTRKGCFHVKLIAVTHKKHCSFHENNNIITRKIIPMSWQLGANISVSKCDLKLIDSTRCTNHNALFYVWCHNVPFNSPSTFSGTCIIIFTT